MDAAKTALQCKNEGNDWFHKGDYDNAIRAYSEAIKLDPSNATFYHNRALVYKQKQMWNLMRQDAEAALKADPTYAKACGLLGQALVESGKLAINTKTIKAGIEKLNECKVLCKNCGQSEMAEKVERDLETAKKILKLKKRTIVLEKRENMLCYMDELLVKQNLPMAQEKEIKRKAKALMEYTHPEPAKIDDLEFLNCRITLQLLSDPVIDNEGHTYERAALQMHMDRNGKFDPTTRKPIVDVYPNRAIKKAVAANYDEYITEEQSTTDYRAIHFVS